MKALSTDSPNLASPAFASALGRPIEKSEVAKETGKPEPAPLPETPPAGVVFNPFSGAVVVQGQHAAARVAADIDPSWTAPVIILALLAFTLVWIVRRLLD